MRTVTPCRNTVHTGLVTRQTLQKMRIEITGFVTRPLSMRSKVQYVTVSMCAKRTRSCHDCHRDTENRPVLACRF